MSSERNTAADVSAERLALRRRMLRRLGIQLPRALTVEQQELVRASLELCANCAAAAGCRSLDEEGSGDTEFCPNVELFSKLRRSVTKS